MALRSTFTSVAVAVQSGPDSWTQPSSSTDTLPCGNARLTFNSVTAENPEYLGTVHRPGDFLLGKTAQVTFTLPIRPPGGASPPSAGAFIPGRFLRAAGFTENILSAAIPVSAEALGSGSTTTAAKLGSTAAGTAQLYKGLALNLSDNGSGYNRQLTAIRDYTSAKLATLFETLGTTPAANYQIPKQLAYQLSASAPNINLAISIWFEAVRYDLINMVVSSCRFVFPASTRSATDFPAIEITLDGDFYAWADEAAPAIGALGAIPVFKDGDFWISNKALGGSSFSVDLGIQVGYAPNPNKQNGNDAAQLISTKRTAQLTLNHNTKATVDFMALADAQAQNGLWAQYGYTAGNMVMFNIPNGRLMIPNADNGGEFVTQTIDMVIDDADKAINLVYTF